MERKKRVLMSLIEKVVAGMACADYLARECLHTGRQRLEFHGRTYCFVSGSDGVTCPLQSPLVGEERLSRCLRDDYLQELADRNPARHRPESSEDREDWRL